VSAGLEASPASKTFGRARYSGPQAIWQCALAALDVAPTNRQLPILVTATFQ
jgi:hypothetical protein